MLGGDQIILVKLARDLTGVLGPQKAFGKGNPRLFQENPGWCNIIIWLEQCKYMEVLKGFLYKSALFGVVIYLEP